MLWHIFGGSWKGWILFKLPEKWNMGLITIMDFVWKIVWFQKISKPHHRGSLEILRRWWVLKAKMFKGKPKLEFLEGLGIKPKRPSMGEVWIFSGTTNCCTLASNGGNHMNSCIRCT